VSQRDDLLHKIQANKALVGIIGMGYVGSSLSDLTVKAKYNTIGFDRDQRKVEIINQKARKYLKASTDTAELHKCDIVIVCVQTPVLADKTPDLTFVTSALEVITDNVRPGQLVIIESTVAAGTTRSIALPILQKSGLLIGTEVFLSFSPERVDPGNKKFGLYDIPKVIGGLNEDSLITAVAFYSRIFKQVVPVSSLEAAEFTKILENTFRLVNISLVNELVTYANAINVDMWEVVDAAATKPFGFMPHYPGPGVGGHCIPVDPYYLLDDAKKRNVHLGLIEEAGKINEMQPKKVVKKTLDVLKQNNGHKKSHKVLLIGVTYKPDIDDVRESPALKVWEDLEKEGISVTYHDPYVEAINGHHSQELSPSLLHESDMVVITTNHRNVDYQQLMNFEKPILDTRNVYSDKKSPNIHRI
jgi:UDP-N-acetyl-D-glucosamine dehydrogenase